MIPLMIDIYRGDPVLDFSLTRAAGIIGVIHKATEGTGFTDSLYMHRRKMWADAGGQLWGAYHFFHGQNPIAEADHFLSVAEPDGNTCLCCDWEDVGGAGYASAQQTEAFTKRIQDKAERSSVIYSGNVAKEALEGRNAYFSSLRLWLAQYGTKYTLQESWTHPWAWQNNGDAYGPGPHNIPGIKGLCDNSTIVQGTVQDFIDSWSGKLIVVPQPVPSPAPLPGQKPALQKGIVATEFGGVGDRQRSAYGGPVDGDKPGVALPFHFIGVRPQVKIHYQDKVVDAEIVDVGPHNTQDAYWIKGTRPRSESQGGNRAGIDLTSSVMDELGVQGAESTRTITVDWEFV